MSLLSAPQTLHADQEHDGLRTAVIIILGLLLLLFFQLTRLLVDRLAPAGLQGYATALSCTTTLPLSLLFAWLIEQWLKQIWPSGRRVTINQEGVVVADKAFPEATQSINWGEDCSSLFWGFPLIDYPRGGRERRLPKNWVCLAGQLSQSDQRVTFFTFVSAPKAAQWLNQTTTTAVTPAATATRLFHQLEMKQIYDKKLRSRVAPLTRPTIPPGVLSSKNGRYWLAERRRWEEGYELTPADFDLLVSIIQDKLSV